jgi:hypothetical protein
VRRFSKLRHPAARFSNISERFRGLLPRLDLARTRSMKYAYLDPDGENVVLRLMPAARWNRRAS